MSSRSSPSNGSTWSPSSRAARSVARRGGDAADGQPSRGQRGQQVRDRGARPQPHGHPVLDQLRRRLGGGSLLSFGLGARWHGVESTRSPPLTAQPLGRVPLASAAEMATIAQPKATDLDTLCINTIRTLSIDAIQKANSGHPGTPMAMAPVAYTLWQRFLRFDPADPIWPNRDRFVLSAGHASMLLYSLLHLTRAQAVDPDYETLGEPSVSLDDIESFRQLDSKAAGHPEYHLTSGVETTTGPLGQGIATTRGDGDRRQVARRALRRRAVRLRRLRDLRRRRPDGGGLRRGRLDRRPSAPRQPLLDLRQQPHLDRRPHRARLQRRRRRALHRLRLERHQGGRRQRPRAADPGVRGLQAGGGAAHADHRRQPHRLRLAAQAGHRRGPRGAARRQTRCARRSAPTAGPRTPSSWSPTASTSISPTGSALAGRRLRAEWEQRVADGDPALAAQIDQMQRRELPEGWDAEIPSFDADPGGIATRKASNEVLNAIAPRVPWLLSGSADLTGSAASGLDLRRGRHLLARGPLGPRPPLRDSRARVGRDLQRAGALQAAPGLVDLPDLLRLRPPGDPPLGADGAAGDPLVQPRLDRPRRGRPDPPAGRAARLPARDAGAERDPPLRRERGRRGVAGDHAAEAPAHRPGADPPERAGARPLQVRLRRGASRAAATCSPTPTAIRS